MALVELSFQYEFLQFYYSTLEVGNVCKCVIWLGLVTDKATALVTIGQLPLYLLGKRKCPCNVGH